MLRADHAATLRLIDRLCVCFAKTSSDEDHPAARYSRQIKGLREKLSSLSATTAASSPTGGHTVPLPPMSALPDSGASINMNGHGSNGNPFSGDNLPWLSTPDTQNHTQFNPATSPTWQMPVHNQSNQPISFPYPNTPIASMSFVAPPHQQPLSEVNNLHPQDFANPANNLGFVTLDDWFGPAGAEQGQDETNALFGGLDLQDFWMKVGPGEAQGGFPFR